MLALVLIGDCGAEQRRRSAVTAAFQRGNPCPSTGLQRGACPGWIKDHIIPLCAGGADHPDNLQWQTVEQAKAKDREERRQCRRDQSKAS